MIWYYCIRREIGVDPDVFRYCDHWWVSCRSSLFLLSNVGCGGRSISVSSIYPAPFNLSSATIGVFHPKRMFIHSLEQHADKFILLGNHLLSFRSVCLHPSLPSSLIFMSNAHLLILNSLYLKRMWTCTLRPLSAVFPRRYSRSEYLVSKKRYPTVIAVRSFSFFDGGWCKGWWRGYLNSSSRLCLAGVGVYYSFRFLSADFCSV